MNAAQAKKISLYDLLSSLGYSPVETRKSGNEVWYRSPFRNESEPSFKIRIDQNVWYDFGEGAGGNILDFVMKYKSCGLSEALLFLGNKSLKASARPVVSNDNEQQRTLDFFDIESPLILNVKPIYHYALKNYLKERCISAEVGFKYLKEISYKVEDKTYFALGFENASGGWEVRNPLFKGCLGKKDISFIEAGAKSLKAFEGFFDFLSFVTISDNSEIDSDVLILNSTAMKGRGVELVKEKNYEVIDVYFDNDNAGKNTLEFFKQGLPGIRITSQNHLYKDFNDLNDFLIKTNLTK